MAVSALFVYQNITDSKSYRLTNVYAFLRIWNILNAEDAVLWQSQRGGVAEM